MRTKKRVLPDGRSLRTASAHAPFLGFAFLAFGLVAISGCKKAADAADDKPVVAVQAVHPHYGAITEEFAADAVLAPIAQAAILPKITAPVRRFYVQRGAHVKAGQLLATLENGDLAAAVVDNRGNLEAAQAAYTTTSASTVPEAATQARLDLQQAKATLDLDNNILKSRQQLLAQGAIPGRDVDNARATALQAQAAYEVAQQKLQALQGSGQKAQLDAAQGQLTSAKGKLQGAEAQLNYTEVRTPIAGVVTDRPLFAGETPAAGAPLVTVMDTSAMVAKLHLAQAEAQRLAIGGKAELTVPGIDEPIPAKVSLISPALDPGSTTVEVWLHVDNRDGHLKPGSMVHATLEGRAFPHALLLPSDAVQRSAESGGHMVMVIGADGAAHKRAVTTGVIGAEQTQILSGVEEGDTVITGGGYGLDDGTKVKIEAADKDDKKDDDAKPSAGKAGEKD